VAVNTGTVLDASETIGIGHAPGMALAAGLATKREVPILAMVGDGCCGIAAGDFETCTRWDIPVVFFHHNNNVMINATWELFWAKTCTPTGDPLKDSWQTLPGIRYDKMFAEVGHHPEYVERAEQIKPAVKRAFEWSMREKKPSFIECPVEPLAMHTSQAQPGRVLSLAQEFKWDQLPDKGKEAVVMLATPEVIARLPKDYQEGIAAAQKK
jgi:thiamine pyrophosphate-dependent acetolactate synthase large subunit-like protein